MIWSEVVTLIVISLVLFGIEGKFFFEYLRNLKRYFCSDGYTILKLNAINNMGHTHISGVAPSSNQQKMNGIINPRITFITENV